MQPSQKSERETILLTVHVEGVLYDCSIGEN